LPVFSNYVGPRSVKRLIWANVVATRMNSWQWLRIQI
jgi:hypothetical protein